MEREGESESQLPALHEDLVLIHETKRGNRDAILVVGQELADRGEAVEPLGCAIGVGSEGAGEDGVAGEEAQDAVQCDIRVRVCDRRKLSGDLGGGEQSPGPSSGYDLKHVQLNGGLQHHRKNRGAGQLHREQVGFLVANLGRGDLRLGLGGGGAHFHPNASALLQLLNGNGNGSCNW